MSRNTGRWPRLVLLLVLLQAMQNIESAAESILVRSFFRRWNMVPSARSTWTLLSARLPLTQPDSPSLIVLLHWPSPTLFAALTTLTGSRRRVDFGGHQRPKSTNRGLFRFQTRLTVALGL